MLLLYNTMHLFHHQLRLIELFAATESQKLFRQSLLLAHLPMGYYLV